MGHPFNAASMDVGSPAAQRQIVDVSTGHLVKPAATTFGAEQDVF
jgi:hypothetical protein